MKEGETGINAETTIDYKKKTIEFKYPIKEGKTQKEIEKAKEFAYFRDNITIIIGGIIGITIATIFFIKCAIIEELIPRDKNAIFQIYMVTTTIMQYLTCIYLAGTTGILLNKTNKKYREGFPKRQGNALIKRRWRKLQLPETNGEQIINRNKIYIIDYDITYFEYKYRGNNKIIKVETKSLEKKTHKKDHMKFYAEITFKKKITEGTLEYR